jgi:hypothetical protein
MHPECRTVRQGVCCKLPVPELMHQCACVGDALIVGAYKTRGLERKFNARDWAQIEKN